VVQDALSVRELEVIALVAAGLTDRAIAERLGIAVKTVNHHVCDVLLKLDAKRRTDAAVIALQLGLISPPPPTRQPGAGTPTNG
jgi:DNA-binding NarL/FixJ family response regulator